jgi:hypothetical protein
MQLSGIPAKFPIAFANNAGPGFTRTIPQNSQIGVTAGAASLFDGFPPVCFSPVGAGGTPPFGADFNGILFETTAMVRWLSAGGTFPYDATFQTAIGGYPQGAIVLAASGGFWVSIVDNNTTDPDTGGAGWIQLGSAGQTRRVTASGAFTIGLTDRTIGLYRTASLATSSATLPSGAPDGWEVWIEDLNDNFFGFPVTITKSGDAASISGSNTAVLNINRQCARFKMHAGSPNIWSFKS